MQGKLPKYKGCCVFSHGVYKMLMWTNISSLTSLTHLLCRVYGNEYAHYHSTTLLLQDTTTTLHYHYTTLLLQDTTTTLHYHYTTLHYHYTTLSLHYTITTLHYYYRTLPLHYTITTWHYCSTTLSLHYTITALHCTILPHILSSSGQLFSPVALKTFRPSAQSADTIFCKTRPMFVKSAPCGCL